VHYNAARIYVRYSKVHDSSRTFFGLREIDLRQLEGHNAFLCFLVDDGSAPVFVPFADFEEVFREAQPATDGQHKVQLISNEGLELYVARQGRFSVEGYVGFDFLERSVCSDKLDLSPALSHSQVQSLLTSIGNFKGHDVFVPASDVAKLQCPKEGLRSTVPSNYREVLPILSEIDVVWISRDRDEIVGLFEVEHTTTIYSGLLRFNDVLLTNNKLSRFCVVADETRRSIFSRQLFRPTFQRSGLSEITSFLEYRNVYDWHGRLQASNVSAALNQEHSAWKR
jgi:hypothetical protein